MGAGGEEEIGTLDRAVAVDSELGRVTIRNRRILYAITSLVLSALVGFAVLEGFGLVDAYGVDTRWVRDEGAGYELGVRYATVSRGAVATPFEIVVHRAGGFDEPVTVAVSRGYLTMWDENGFYPTPSSETTSGGWLLWEFDPPEGDTLSFAYDARIEPAAQEGRDGEIAVLDDGVAVATVRFRTRVLP